MLATWIGSARRKTITLLARSRTTNITAVCAMLKHWKVINLLTWWIRPLLAIIRQTDWERKSSNGRRRAWLSEPTCSDIKNPAHLVKYARLHLLQAHLSKKTLFYCPSRLYSTPPSLLAWLDDKQLVLEIHCCGQTFTPAATITNNNSWDNRLQTALFVRASTIIYWRRHFIWLCFVWLQ